jgi:dipeptide transport system substrate-binding protein
MPDLIKTIVKVDDYTVKFVLNASGSADDRQPGHGFRLDLLEGICRQLDQGRQVRSARTRSRSAPVRSSFVAYQKDAVIRYKAHSRLLGRQAADRQPGLRHHPGQLGAPAEAEGRRVPRDALSEPGRSVAAMEIDGYHPDGAGRPQRRLPGLQHHGGPVRQSKVRKALNMAINKQAILDAVFQGAGQVGQEPDPADHVVLQRRHPGRSYDPEAAKKMLAEAGVTDLSMKIWAMPVQRPYNPNARRMAEVIQADFCQDRRRRSRSSPTSGASTSNAPRTSTATARCCSAGPVTTAIRTTSSPFCSAATPSAAPTAPSGATSEFEDLIQKAKIVSDPAERTKLYEQAQVVFKEQAPWATIAHSVVHMPMREGQVVDYVMDPFGGHWFDGVDLAE